jgi:hypothetical protein
MKTSVCSLIRRILKRKKVSKQISLRHAASSLTEARFEVHFSCIGRPIGCSISKQSAERLGQYSIPHSTRKQSPSLSTCTLLSTRWDTIRDAKRRRTVKSITAAGIQLSSQRLKEHRSYLHSSDQTTRPSQSRKTQGTPKIPES